MRRILLATTLGTALAGLMLVPSPATATAVEVSTAISGVVVDAEGDPEVPVDTTAPSLTSFQVTGGGTTQGPGGSISIDYTTSEPVSTVWFRVTDSVGRNKHYLGGDGRVDIPAAGLDDGTVLLTLVQMYDHADNRTDYRPGGVSYTPSGGTGPTTNPFDFTAATFTVGGSSVDATAPSLTSFQVTGGGTTQGPGGSISIDYTTSEPVSPAWFGFTDSVGRTMWYLGGDGRVDIPAADLANGTVLLTRVHMIDDADNRTDYRPGGVSYIPSGGTGPTTNPFDFTAATFTRADLPSMPSLLEATAKNQAVSLVWSPPTDEGGSPTTGYRVTVSPGGRVFTTIPSERQLTVRGLENGAAYTFEVRASNAAGEGAAASQTATPALQPPSRVPQPIALSGDESAAASWSAPHDDGGSPVTGYTVTATPGGKTVTVPGDATTATLTGMDNGTGYTFTVVATNAIGDSAASTPSNQVTPAGVPDQPAAPTATRGDRSATVSWTKPSGNGSPVTGYTVTSSPGGVTRTITGAETTSTTLSGLTNGTGYTFIVKATNAVGDSAASSPSNTVTPVAPATAPGAPTAVTATPGNGSATVSWTKPSGNGSPVTGYTVTSSPGGVTKTITGAETTSTTLSGLTNGTGYTFIVKATNAVGDSAASSPSNTVTPVAPATAPGAPTAVTATPGNGSATVSWTKPSGNGSPVTGYTVTSSPGGVTKTITGAETTSTIIGGLTNGTGYTFIVKATNAVGTSTSSDPSGTITPAGAPGTPRVGAAKSGAVGGKLTGVATWNPPSTNGGEAITGYRVTAYRYRANGTIASTTRSPMLSPAKRGYNMILTTGRYRFTCTAFNTVGASPASGRSNLITAR